MSSIPTFDVEEALRLATFSEPAWNAEGTYVGYQRFHDGESSFVARSVEQPIETDLALRATDDATSRAEFGGEVSGYDWHPDRETSVAVVRDGDVLLADVETEETETVAEAEADHSSPAWHPDGAVLAYIREHSLWLHDVDEGRTRELATDVADLFGPTPLEWSSDGRYLATLTETEEETLALSVYEPFEDVDDDSSRTVWERAPSPAERVVADTFEWAGDTLVYAEDSTDGTERRYRAIRPEQGRSAEEGRLPGEVVLTETDDRGLASAKLAGHESGRVALLAAPSGYHHVYVLDVDVRRDAVADRERPGFDGPGLLQVTSGEFEARGDALDRPEWDESGDRLAYVTNEADSGERRLHVATVDAAEVRAVSAFENVDGNAVYPTWGNGRIACLRSGRTTPADVHVFDPENDAARRVSAGHTSPDSLAWFPDPEPISFESSSDGRSVHGYVYTPPDESANEDLPAVVWAHGGPVRQMRRGFHHMRSYAFFHAFNHVLVDRGYAVLELNYRGGIGYGRDYELGIHHRIGDRDVQDCVDAASFLRAREDIGDSVGFWGLSYGGFLANAVATKTDSFDCAVNFAGIWDWRDWVRYATDRNWGAGRRFRPLFGGHPDEEDPTVEERYRTGSPCDHVDGLDTPLFALHGTADPNVPFAQMDETVTDLVECGAEFEMAYYPDEDHMFQESETWEDAMNRVLPFLDDHLDP